MREVVQPGQAEQLLGLQQRDGQGALLMKPAGSQPDFANEGSISV